MGNVTKVKQLTLTAHQDILKALREKELSIHRAWVWSKQPPAQQVDMLWEKQSKTGVGKTIRHLISRHVLKGLPATLTAKELLNLASVLESGKTGSVNILPIRAPGNFILVTEQLLASFEKQKELTLTCATNTR